MPDSIFLEPVGMGSMVWDWIRVLLVLLLILPLVYLATRLYARRIGGAVRTGSMRLLETIPLGAGRSACLVEVGERLLVLGVTNHQISLLTEISDPDEVRRLRAGLRGQRKDPDFIDVLLQKIGRNSTEGDKGGLV